MQDLINTLDSLSHPKILVLGDIILDKYTWGNAERVSPEAPVLVLRVESQEVRLGGAASVAGLLKSLEADVTLAGVIGDDANGRVTRRLLDEAGIMSDLVLCDEDRPTTCKERLIGCADGKHPHQVLRVDEEMDHLISELLRQQLIDGIIERLEEFDAVLISDYAKGVCQPSTRITTFCYPPSLLKPPNKLKPKETIVRTESREPVLMQTVIAAAKNQKIPVLVDPSRLRDADCYRGASLLKPNRVEAELSSDVLIDSIAAAMRAGETLCQQLDLEAVVITLDRDGMVLSRKDASSEHFSITPREVCDITGAGDTAFALLGLVLAHRHAEQRLGESDTNRQATFNTDDQPLSQEYQRDQASQFSERNEALSTNNLFDAVRLANIASGLQVERFGVAPITRSGIRTAFLRTRFTCESKIKTLDQLQTAIERPRREKKKIVFTNGCFDMLHVGHLACLQSAAKLGDILIVAINSDEQVHQLKGPDRPMIGQFDRAALLSGLACVDHIIIFNEPTPHELLKQIRPDILVKGGTTGEIVGREVVESYGGGVCMTETIDGVSTTQLIQRTRDRAK